MKTANWKRHASYQIATLVLHVECKECHTRWNYSYIETLLTLELVMHVFSPVLQVSRRLKTLSMLVENYFGHVANILYMLSSNIRIIF